MRASAQRGMPSFTGSDSRSTALGTRGAVFRISPGLKIPGLPIRTQISHGLQTSPPTRRLNSNSHQSAWVWNRTGLVGREQSNPGAKRINFPSLYARQSGNTSTLTQGPPPAGDRNSAKRGIARSGTQIEQRDDQESIECDA